MQRVIAFSPLLTLLTNQRSLISRAAETWIALARLTLMLTALSIAVPWFVFLRRTFDESFFWALAVSTSLFLLVWSLCTAILTHDSLRIGRRSPFLVSPLIVRGLILAILTVGTTPVLTTIFGGTATAKWLSTAFLMAILLNLILYKLFEPLTVKIYYSEQVQDAYESYLTGGLDEYLGPSSEKRPMTPIEFFIWFRDIEHARDYTRRRRLEAEHEEMRERNIHRLEDAFVGALDEANIVRQKANAHE